MWLHLLQFCISNQTLNLAEDANNKPWRPIPSGRISFSAARRLRWMLVGVCIVYSATCNVLPMGLTLLAATIMYNEMHLSSHWFSRNALNAIGYASFSIGAANAGCTGTRPVPPAHRSITLTSLLSLLYSLLLPLLPDGCGTEQQRAASPPQRRSSRRCSSAS